MFFQPIFNQNSDRPYRWALQAMESGNTMERYWVPEDHFTHWTFKEDAKVRDVYSDVFPFTSGSFTPMRKKTIGFLTTYHREFYEDGKYTEVYNDPINYILPYVDYDYDKAFPDAEQRIGNYRMGVRRHVTHLGGTISEDELDMFEDDQDPPVALTSFPLMPPLPPTDFIKPFRTKLITSDVGYIDYIKTAHPTVTPVTDKYAYQSKQSTGFRHFIFDAGNANMKFESTGTPTVSTVTIDDIETVVDVGIAAAIGAGALPGQTFIPRTPQDDGTWTLINVPGQHMIKSTPTALRLQMYDAGFAAFVSEIMLDQATGDIFIVAGTTTVTITKDGDVAIDAGANDMTLTATNLDLTVDTLKVSGDLKVNTDKFVVDAATGTATSAGDLVGVNLDMSGTAQIAGVTTHGA